MADATRSGRYLETTGSQMLRRGEGIWDLRTNGRDDEGGGGHDDGMGNEKKVEKNGAWRLRRFTFGNRKEKEKRDTVVGNRVLLWRFIQ